MAIWRLVVATGVCGWMVLAGDRALAQDIALATNASGITIGGSKPSWTTGFGSMNGLGLGTAGTGQTVLTAGSGNGVFYTSPYNITISGASNSVPAVVRGYVSTNFGHSSILAVYTCVSSCASAASYSAISTSSASPSDIIGQPGLTTNQTVNRSLGVFVSNQNGAAAFTGTDSATITLLVYNGSTNSLKHTYTLALNNPTENVQTALRLLLATASGGRTISSGADFSLSYGTVNALGISPGTGLTATTASGGGVYSTPYLLQPKFAGFSSTFGTLKTHVSGDFVHPAQLELRDSSNGTAFSAISKASGSPTTISSTATTASTLTRYLGLFVSSVNGGTTFTGTDNATVTFTLVVP